jgi:integrase
MNTAKLSIVKVKSKRYEGVYLYKKMNGDISYYVTYKTETNRSVTKKIGDKSKGITEAYCNQIRNETIVNIKNGELPPKVTLQKKHSVITLDNVADFYFNQKTNKSLQKFVGKYNLHIKSVLGNKDVNSISSDDMKKFQQTLLDKKLANHTVNCYIDIVSAIINFAITNDIYSGKNPTKLVRKLKVDNVRERILSRSEIEDLLEAVSDDWLLNLFVRLSLSTAARKSTILNIKKRDVNMQNETILLKDFKNESTYNGFIMDDDLKMLLKNRISAIGSDDLIIGDVAISDMERHISRKMSVIFYDLFNYDVDETQKDFRKRKVVTHTLRHTVLSHLAMNGESPYVIKQISNHKTMVMVERYIKLSPTMGKAPMQKLWNFSPTPSSPSVLV